MTTPTRPQLNAEKSLGGYTQRHARKLYIGELGNNSGVVDDTARTTSGQDFVFVRLNQDANQVVSALAATSFPHVADIIVILELVERKGAPYYQVLGIAPNIVYSTATATWSGVPGEHASQHERRDRNAGGFDPLDVYTRALVNLRARAQTTPDLTLHVEHGFYIFSSVKQYLGGNSPTFVPPATASSQRWDLLYLGSDDALHITSGAAVAGFGTPVYPACPVDAIPLAYVLLRTAQTSILEADITDARVLWTGTPSTSVTLLSLLGWYDAKVDGGCHGDGVTDDTAHIQTLINTATANGTQSATIYFPPGTYLLGGALQDAGAFNGQIIFPDVSHAAQGMITLRLIGAAPPPFNPIYGLSPVPIGFSVLKSTLAGATGTAAVFSAGNRAPSATNGNNLQVVVEDMICIAPDNPTLSFWNLSDAQGGTRIFKNVQVTTPGGLTGSITQPTNANAYGVKMPQRYFANWSGADGLSVGCFYTCVYGGELGMYHGLVLGQSIVGFEQPQTFYPSVIFDVTITSFEYGIRGSGAAGLTVLSYTAEHTTSPAWKVTVYDLDDVSNYLFGTIQWYGAATGGAPDHSFVKNGGTGMFTWEVGELMPASGVTAATYGSATQVPQVAVDKYGRVTSASNVAITIPNETIDDRVAALLVAGTNITLVYDDPGNTLTISASGGGGTGGHLHGLTRWLADGGTTFDLPDIAEYVDAVADNGAIVDPSIYSLSANAAQIVFDAGPTAAHVLTAQYVIAQI